uniref:Uncharacterized protein n=1 Tax=Anguilla anguilla TaxID=7936 RepID=A0A0E9V1T0_ANGAN
MAGPECSFTWKCAEETGQWKTGWQCSSIIKDNSVGMHCKRARKIPKISCSPVP